MFHKNGNVHEGMFIDKHDVLVGGCWIPKYRVFFYKELISDQCDTVNEAENKFFKFTGRNRPR